MTPLQQRTNVIDEKIVNKIAELKRVKQVDKIVTRVFDYNKKIQQALDPWDKLKLTDAKCKYLYKTVMKLKGNNGRE